MKSVKQKTIEDELWIGVICNTAQALLLEHGIDNRIKGGYSAADGLLLSLSDPYPLCDQVLAAFALAFRCQIRAAGNAILLKNPDPLPDQPYTPDSLDDNIITAEYEIGEAIAPLDRPARPYSFTLKMEVKI